jgi:hypothetical protein
LRHRASSRFWACYHALPDEVRDLADKNFKLLREDSFHPSLRFKRIGRVWSARVGAHFRALAVQRDDGFVWIWIGPHDEYDKLL